MKYTLWGCLAFALIVFGCGTTKPSINTEGAKVIQNALLNSPIHTIIAGAGNILYAATEDSGVVRSIDMGEHWEKFSGGMTGAPYISQFVSNSRGDIFAATIGNGLYELPVGTQAWQRVDATAESNGLLRVSSLAVAPLDNSIYAATIEGGVYRSSDNGATWRFYNEELGIMNINTIAVTDKNTLYVRCVGGGVFRRGVSEPPNNTWKPINNGIDDPYVTCIGAQHNGTVFVGTRNGKIYRMNEDDMKWSDVSAGLPVTIINWLGSTVWGTEVAGTKEGLYAYDQQAGKWSPVPGVAQTADVRSACILLDGTTFAGTEDSGIIKTTIAAQ